MKIVLTHASPDFDALASAYAAWKLHGADHIAIITGTEANVHEFIKSSRASLPIKRYSQKDIEAVETIERLIITDCKQKKRLGKFAALLPKARSITVYDHHPAYAKDIEADEEIVRNTGSAAAILVTLLKERKISLSPFEATLLALGIYEDTGLLSFRSVTPEDALALAYLLSQGADPSAAGDFIKRDLNRAQIFVLNELLLNLSVITVGGVNVAMSYASEEEYTDEAAYIAQKLMTMEGLDSLFVLISTGGRIVLVGRSKTRDVDAASVAREFGGGGHPSAASAIIKDMLLPEAAERLKFVIRESIRPVKTVGELMNSPVKYVSSDAVFEKALDITMKYNLNNMPVVEKGRVVGIISRKDILHGMKHGLKNEPVRDIMQVEFDVAKPDTPFYEAEEIMVCKGQKLLPVEDENGLVGVVSRTDLLRLMHEEITLRSTQAEKARADLGLARSRNVRSLMKEALPQNVLSILQDIGMAAEKRGMKAYAVGGFVRDLLMKNKNLDIDIVVEGDAPKFALEYAKKRGGKASVHAKFKTATAAFPDGVKIDFAAARTEYYMTPAALPEVEEASIKNDLFRRDFTINAMAVRLDGAEYGTLLDFFSGQKDINEKKIRALHSLSFVDDPSRAFRAIRFAVRFGFAIGAHTERLIKHAESLDLFGRIAGPRLFLELKYILDEKGYVRALEMMKKYDLLRFYDPRINFDASLLEKFERFESLLSWFVIQTGKSAELWRARFAILFSSLGINEFEEVLAKFGHSSKMFDNLFSDHKLMEAAASAFRRNKNPKPSFITGICSQMSPECLLASASALGENKREIIKNYITSYSSVKPELRGGDIVTLGVPKGPAVKKLLDALKNAKLDGLIKCKNDEITFVENYLKSGEE